MKVMSIYERAGFGTLALLPALLAGLILAASCGADDLVTNPCPGGFVLIDGVCQPRGSDVPPSPDTGPPDTVSEDVSPAPSEIADSPEVGSDTAPVDTVQLDTEPAREIRPPTGAIGDPCNRPADCKDDSVCLGWDFGYCSVRDCDLESDDCPEGAACLELIDFGSACYKLCTEDSDCRVETERYACKTLPRPHMSGVDPVSICHVVKAGAQPRGERCQSHADCRGKKACVTGLPGGACLELFCLSDEDCGGESICTRFNGVPTCMPACDKDEDCEGIGDGTLVCGELRDLGGTPHDVCLSGVTSLPIGEQCLSHSECQTDYCEILGHGYCPPGIDDGPPQPCSTPEDCPGAAGCQPGLTIGACTRGCGVLQPCPIGGVCVLDSRGVAACRPPCQTSDDCREDAGWRCVYGVPLDDEQARGHYCGNITPRGIGTPCQGDAGCDGEDSFCKRPESGTNHGYCSRGCGSAGAPPCPFGTVCLGVGERFCHRVCNDELDCPPDHGCVRDSELHQTLRICTPE